MALVIILVGFVFTPACIVSWDGSIVVALIVSPTSRKVSALGASAGLLSITRNFFLALNSRLVAFFSGLPSASYTSLFSVIALLSIPLRTRPFSMSLISTNAS